MRYKDKIPHYYLFGEPPKETKFDFLHIENIYERSSPLLGEIKPHFHSNLNQIFIFEKGNGNIEIDGNINKFFAPTIVFIPNNIVHGFKFSNDIEGHVITIANSYLSHVFGKFENIAHDFKNYFNINCENFEGLNQINLWLFKIIKELSWNNFSSSIIIEACLAGLLVEIQRFKISQLNSEKFIPKYNQLFLHFNKLIEENYKKELDLEFYLRKLKVTKTQLRYACNKAGEKTPLKHVLMRRIIEAQRLLIYSEMPIAQIGFAIGFNDPIYFTRYFSKINGVSPNIYRKKYKN